MGTRGALIFRAGGKDKVAYNHFDSYPSYLGKAVVEYLKGALSTCGSAEAAAQALRAMIVELRVVKDGEKPTPEDIERLRPFTNIAVSEQSAQDWYCLLHKTQGDIEATLRAGYIEDSRGFLDDSLFCEWAYGINTDDGVLEFYRGFQKKSHKRGRYAGGKRAGRESEYESIALVTTMPLWNIPEDWTDRLTAALKEMNPEDEAY